MASKNPSATLQYMQEANGQLSDEVRRLREGDYKKLFQQTRSFLDGLQRTSRGQDTMYGASITRISQVRDALVESKKMDGENTTHFTKVIGYYCSLVDALHNLLQRCIEWFGDPVRELTVHHEQQTPCEKIQKELQFWEKFLDENKDLSDLHKYKTLEEFRGLNTGEVSLWGAVVNLIPVLLKTADGIASQVAKWTAITLRLGMGIFNDQAPAPKMTNGAGRTGGSRGSGSATGAKKVSMTQQRPSSNTHGGAPKKTYADRMDEKYKGRISLLERPPWKPSSQRAHNLYPQLPIHLGNPKQHAP
ncbi:uncharacterized protein [Amphiura filiformis]|uniref:uncharacterized protein n=1 Tax=Amphiura filiformis TaxID=82378 RepID=UPI003B2261D4